MTRFQLSWRRWTVLCLALAWTQLACAQLSIAIVTQERGGVYDEAVAGFLSGLGRKGGAPISARHLTTAELARSADLSARLYVAFGAEATAALAHQDLKSPLISALLPRTSFEAALQAVDRKTAPKVTAVYLNQPIARQLNLIKAALPQAARVGVLLGADSAWQKSELEKEARLRKLQLQMATVDNGALVVARLSDIIDEIDVLLVMADRTVYNSNTIPNIFLTAFRARVPIVAFSPAYVRAGALLALYSTPAQIGKQAAELAQAVLAGKPLPEPRHPDDFHVEANANVARTFDVHLSRDELEERLRRMGE